MLGLELDDTIFRLHLRAPSRLKPSTLEGDGTRARRLVGWVLAAALAGCSAPPGLPYTVGVGAHRENHALEGTATWYGPGLHGRRTASGERFDMHQMTAAHKSLPFGTRIRVTDLRTRRSVVVRINDRGPFGAGILDLSKAAARRLGILRRGRARVRLRVLRWGRR